MKLLVIASLNIQEDLCYGGALGKSSEGHTCSWHRLEISSLSCTVRCSAMVPPSPLLLKPLISDRAKGQSVAVGNSPKFVFWENHRQASWEDAEDANCHGGAGRNQHLLF